MPMTYRAFKIADGEAGKSRAESCLEKRDMSSNRAPHYLNKTRLVCCDHHNMLDLS
jgi:hypothetical protein